MLLRAWQVANAAPAYADPAFGALVVDAGRRVYAVWRETLRYHVNKASDREVETVRSQTVWLLGRSRVL